MVLAIGIYCQVDMIFWDHFEPGKLLSVSRMLAIAVALETTLALATLALCFPLRLLYTFFVFVLFVVKSHRRFDHILVQEMNTSPKEINILLKNLARVGINAEFSVPVTDVGCTDRRQNANIFSHFRNEKVKNPRRM